MKWRWLSLVLSLLLLLALLYPLSVVDAFDGRSGESVVIPAGEVVNDDLYIAATEATIDGEVNGDVYFFGETLTINGRVNGDVNGFGQALVVQGTVEDDIRFAGAVFYLGERAQIGSDLIAFGASLDLRPDSRIGQDVLFFGGQAYLGAEIGRNLQGGAEAVMLTGHVMGNADLTVTGQEGTSEPPIFGPAPVPVPQIRSGLTIDPSARVDGDLTYRSLSALEVPAQNVGGKVTYEELEEMPQGETIESRLLSSLRSWVTLLFFGILFAGFSPRLLENSAKQVRERLWAALGWGVLAYVAFLFALLVIVVLIVLLAAFFGVLTLGNISALLFFGGLILVAGLIFAFVFVTTYLSKILVGWQLGKWLTQRFLPQWAGQRYAPLLGVALLALALQVPYLGFVLGVLALFIGLGALWLTGPTHLTRSA